MRRFIHTVNIRFVCWNLILFCMMFQSPIKAYLRLPHFSDYPVHTIYTGKSAPLNSKFKNVVDKTNIKEAVQRKADFAGHYILVVGSCGTSCRSISVIDARTGMVYWFGSSLEVSSLGGKQQETEYYLQSKLLILRGCRNENQRDFGVHYYIFERNHFRHLRTVLYH